MTRVDELQKKYPSIPRDVILKYEVMVRGIRATDDLYKAGEWRPAMNLVYQSKDFDGSLQELADKAPWTVRPGLMLRPPKNMRYKSGLGAEIRLRSTSPYTIREVSEGRFALYEGDERVEEIYFLRRKPRTTPEPVTSKGTPISSIIDIYPRCFIVTLTRYCQYFSTGEQCKFCNFNASHEDARAVGLDVPLTNSLDETVEAYQIRSSEVRQLEGFLIMGGLAKAEQEAKMYLAYTEALASAAPYKPDLGVHGQPIGRKDMQRLKEAGLDSFSLQMEVMDPQLFADICPGKAKHSPHERWMEAFHEAVDVFGVGNVGGKLVPGLTLLSPIGHKTWQEARDYHIEANRWMIRNGVAPNFVPLWWAPGSVYCEDRSNLEKFPPAEYHLEVGLAHHEDMLEYGLYAKLNKFLVCALDCSTVAYAGDIGMLTLAGDVGQWMADVVPEEANWLAHFITSIKPATRERVDRG